MLRNVDIYKAIFSLVTGRKQRRYVFYGHDNTRANQEGTKGNDHEADNIV